MTKDYEILPIDEISKLREEMQELRKRKTNPEDSRLQSSIEGLKTSVDRLRELFDDVQRDLLRDFEERERPEDLMKRLIEQNKIVADSLIALSGKISELTGQQNYSPSYSETYEPEKEKKNYEPENEINDKLDTSGMEQELKKIETSIRQVKPPGQSEEPINELEQQNTQTIPEEPQPPQQEIPQQPQQQSQQQNVQPQTPQPPEQEVSQQQNTQEPHPTSNMSSEELAKMYEVYKQQQQNKENIDFDKETYNDLQKRKQEFVNKDKPNQTFEDDMPKPPQPKKGFLGMFKK